MKRPGSLAAGIVSAVVPFLLAVGGAALMSACGSCQSTVRTAPMPVIAAGTFDGAVTDPATHRLYLADRTAKGVDVIDISPATPRFMTTVPLSDTPAGLALAPERGRLYAALAGGSLAVIDTYTRGPHAMKVVDTVKVDGDLIDYSPRTGRLYVATGSQEVVTVDATTDKVRMRYAAKASVGQPRYDPADGLLYVTAPETNSLLRIDPATGNITQTYVVKNCHPHGLAINPARQLAMVSCGGSVGFVNLLTGAYSVTRSVQGGDIVTYDDAADRFVVASSHSAVDSAVGVFSGSGEFVASVAADPKAHAAVFDAAHGVVYAPGASGLMSFAPAACAPAPDWLRFLGGLSIFAVPFAGMLAFLVWYAHRIRRHRTVVAAPSYQELQEEDLAMERERMRALEEGILGPG